MPIKKSAALLLAAALTVSLLAGCRVTVDDPPAQTGSPSPVPSETVTPEPEPTPTEITATLAVAGMP